MKSLLTQILEHPVLGWAFIIIKWLVPALVLILISIIITNIWNRSKEKKKEEGQIIRDEKGAKEIKELKQQVKEGNEYSKTIITILNKQNPAVKLPEPEQQANKKLLEALVASKNPKAIETTNYLNQGNIVAGVNVLKALDKENPSVETKLWLASILDYTDPEETKNYLKQAVKLEPKNLDALNKYGLLLMRLGEVELAIKQFKQILKLTNDDTCQGQGIGLGNLGSAYLRLGKVKKAIDFYEKALVISQEIGDRQGEGSDLGNLGLAYADLGEVKKAIDFYEKALVISQEIGDRQGEGNRLGNLGSAYLRLGEVKEAIDFYEKALVISQEIGDRQGEGSDLGNLGSAYADLGEVNKAKDHYNKALVIFKEIKSPNAKIVENNIRDLENKQD